MKRLLKAFLYSCSLSLLSLLVVSFFWKEPLLLTFLMVLVSAIMLIVWRKKEDLYLYTIVGLTGALAEAVAIAFGAWTYTLPTAIGIPIWLPFLWGIAGVVIKKISLEIQDFLKK
jgi:hypothetical protein